MTAKLIWRSGRERARTTQDNYYRYPSQADALAARFATNPQQNRL